MIITWGYSWVLMKEALDYMEPLAFVGMRCLTGALVLLPLTLRTVKGTEIPSGSRFFNYLLVGIFQTTAMFAFLIYGMKFVTAGKSAVFLYTMPVWTIILFHFLTGDKITRSRWTGTLLGLAGILFIIGWDTITTQSAEILFGEMLIIIAAICWAIANIIVKKRMAGDSPYRATSFQLLLGSILLLVLSFATEDFFAMEITPYSLYIILFTGVIASAVNFSIWFYLIRNADMNLTTFSSMLVPVCGLIFDRILLGTVLDAGIIVGGILILFSIHRVSGK